MEGDNVDDCLVLKILLLILLLLMLLVLLELVLLLSIIAVLTELAGIIYKPLLVTSDILDAWTSNLPSCNLYNICMLTKSCADDRAKACTPFDKSLFTDGNIDLLLLLSDNVLIGAFDIEMAQGTFEFK